MVDIFSSEGLSTAEQLPPQSDISAGMGRGNLADKVAVNLPKDSPMTAPGNAPAPPPLADPEAAMNAQNGTPQAGNDNSSIISTPNQTDSTPGPNLEDGTAMGGKAGLAGPEVNQGNGPKDIFQSESVPPPAVPQINDHAFNQGINTADPKTPEQKQVADYANDVQKQYQQVAQTRFTPDQIQAMKDKGPIGFFEAFSKLGTGVQQPPNVGIGPLPALQNLYSDTISQFQLADIAKQKASGQPITPSDDQKLQDYVDRQTELATRGLSWGGKAAQVVKELPSFIVGWYLTDGVGAAVEETAAQGLAKVGIENGLAQTIGTKVAAGAARTPFMPGVYIPAIGEVALNDSIAVTDKGQATYNLAKESPAMAVLKGFGYTVAQNIGQEFAGPIGEGLASLAGKASPIAMSAVSKLPAAVQESLYSAYKAIQPNATLSEALSAVGWHGMLGQLGANRVTDALTGALNLATDKDYTFDDFMRHLTPTPDQFAVEAGLVAIGGGIHAATNLGMNILQARGVPTDVAAETMRNMTATERETFVTQNSPTPKSEFPQTNMGSAEEEKMAALERLHDNPETTPEQKANIQDEMGALAQKVASGYPTIHADASIIEGQVDASQEITPPPIQEKQSAFNQMWAQAKDYYKNVLYPQLFNDLQPIQDLAQKARAAGAEVRPGEDTKLLASFARSTPEWIRLNQMVNTTEWDVNGNQVITGKSLKAVYDDFDNKFMDKEPNWKQRHKDFGDYQIAQTLLEDSAAKRLEITPKQQGQYVDNLVRLSEKYGDDFRFFETFAQEARDWDNRILHNLVSSGEKSQEWYDGVTNSRDKYTPLGRIVENEGFSPAVTASGLGQDVNPNRIGALKNRGEGSDLEIRDPFLNRMKNSAIVLQKSATNNLRRNMAKFSDFYPNDVKVVEPPVVKLGKGQFTNYFDPKLRDKLQALIEQFGGRTERDQSVKVPGKRGVMGYYDPMENLVKLKIGATEGTMAHEAGHLLDEKLGLQEKILDPQTRTELRQLAQDRLNSKISLEETEEGLKFQEEKKKAGTKYTGYINSDPEIMANFFDAYVNSPDAARKIAPEATARFEHILDSDPNLQFIKDIKPSTNRTSETVEKDVYGKATTAGPNTIPFYENGERKFLELSDPIFKAFNNMPAWKPQGVEKIIGAPFRAAKNLLQFGATSTPEFILRHAFRSIGTSWINSEGRATPLDFMKGMANVLGKSDLYHEWSSSSGKFDTFMPLDDKSLAKSYTDMFQKKGVLDYLNPLNAIKGLKEVGDQSARVGVFNKYKEAGYSDLEAGLMSLEATGNFGRHGSFIKKVNQYAPFFNDMMQGGDRFIRAYAKDPAAFTMRGIAAITLPQLMLTGYYLYGADQKTRDEYLEFPSWRRALFSNIKIGNQWVPVPRFFAPGYLFGSLPEQMMVHAYNGYHPEPQNAWLEMLRGAANSVSPIFDWSRAMNPLFKSAIEDITNYNFFAGHAIYPQYLDKLPAAQRKTTYTSETSQALGKIFNFSPAEIDETVRNMAGGMGQYALQLSDMGIDAANRAAGKQVPQKPSAQLSDVPGIKGFAERSPSGYQSASATEFFNNFDRLQQLHGSIKGLANEDMADFQKQNAVDLEQYKPMLAAEKEMSSQNKQIKAILADPNMNGDEKTKQIQQLQDNITQIAKRSNIQYSQARGQK